METIRAALVDDEPAFRSLMRGYLQRYAAEGQLECELHEYPSGLDFLSDAKVAYDLVLLDVEMPHLDGIETARRLRKTDQTVGIIFVTNMAQYAIHGYEVNAIDYIVKPVEYFTFAYKLKKALRFCALRQEKELVLIQETGMVRLPYSSIYYLAKEKNYIVYHSDSGIFRERGTMAEKKSAFLESGFAECSSGCVVNLSHVSRVKQEEVWVGSEIIPISRSKRRSFLNALMDYYGR